MYRVLVVLRTAFLLFIVGFALWTTPVEVWGAQVRVVDVEALRRVHRVMWIAVGWIGFETVIGWILWKVRGRRAAREREVAAAARAAPAAAAPSAPPRP